ncbi:MAG: DUF4293 family protein [Balneolaceae bacterium]
MIQRIQTIFLALAAILNCGVFFTPIYRHTLNDPSAWIGISFAIFLTGTMLVSFAAIFFYSNRPNQIKWVKMAIYFQIAALAIAVGVLFTLGGFGTFLWREVASIGLIATALVLMWTSIRYIKKDEELVKSMDRIR